MGRIEQVVFGARDGNYFFRRESLSGNQGVLSKDYRKVLDGAELVLEPAKWIVLRRDFELPLPEDFRKFNSKFIRLLSDKGYKKLTIIWCLFWNDY